MAWWRRRVAALARGVGPEALAVPVELRHLRGHVEADQDLEIGPADLGVWRGMTIPEKVSTWLTRSCPGREGDRQVEGLLVDAPRGCGR